MLLCFLAIHGKRPGLLETVKSYLLFMFFYHTQKFSETLIYVYTRKDGIRNRRSHPSPSFPGTSTDSCFSAQEHTTSPSDTACLHLSN